ncbi:unnamed protein product [Pieris brassicae]|uniref:N-acetyltransferase domain-containing protein n=1 Tax=Pieris brassicae TaxID=7116 RepID=A0A9P0XKA7_PIEBR|nr:unnamed protein product [Pieris brassicae]
MTCSEIDLQVLPLHKHPQYLEACVEMINEEWPRSKTARMMSLTASCDNLPTSLILINNKMNLLGHAKLTRLPNIPNSCFVETVVITKHMRGKKLGTFLMRKVECYCKNVLHLKMLHLSTKGQEEFYSKLGFEVCPPVSTYGNPVSIVLKPDIPEKMKKTTCGNIPPPPPLPKLQSVASTNIKSSKTFMFKYL